MTELPDIVVGSGPAGVSTAKALLGRGRKVVMLDGGKELGPEGEARRDALAARDPSDWTDADRAAWMRPQYEAAEGQIRRYGSDFAMEPASATLADPPGWFGLRASRAVGGLSNLWGAAVLPYRQEDMTGWPITDADLSPHYRAVAQFMPIAGTRDDLHALLPAFPMSGRTGIPPASQAETLLSRLAGAREELAALGIRMGGARQAVDTSCRRCGMCLHGCPFGLIWKAGDTVAEMRTDPGFAHRPGQIVTAFEEGADSVTLRLKGGDSVKGARVFIGAGVLETARILLASLGDLDRLVLRDSQHVFLPMIQRWRNRTRPDRGAFHTLPQIFLELDAPEISPFLVHAQFYGWNEHYARDLIRNYGSKLPFSAPFFTALARRLIVAQIFLHSDRSHRIALTRAANGRLSAELEANGETDATAQAAASRIGAAMGKLGLSALTFAARPGGPGSSFHVGASLPMAGDPRLGQSDALGRPYGLSRVHVIDATTLPAIPATTITFSVMANAHRIGARSG